MARTRQTAKRSTGGKAPVNTNSATKAGQAAAKREQRRRRKRVQARKFEEVKEEEEDYSAEFAHLDMNSEDYSKSPSSEGEEETKMDVDEEEGSKKGKPTPLKMHHQLRNNHQQNQLFPRINQK